MPTVFTGRWLLPIAQRPIPDGWVAVAENRILGFGDASSRPSGDACHIDGAILPGLVNAHLHLELSWMRGQVPPAPSMPAWVTKLMALRRTVGHEPAQPIRDAIGELHACGTALVGDITNTLAAYEPLANSALSAVIFRELLGFSVPDPKPVIAVAQDELGTLTPVDRMRTAIVPHAPYSVSPALLQAIGDASPGRPVSIHLAESVEELDFLRHGGGPWRELLMNLGVWSDDWQAPGVGPVAYLASLGLLTDRLIAVHGVNLTDDDLRALAAAGATVVTCPRSNRWVGAGDPPIERFYASGVRVAVGTDSLASVEDLNLWSELARMRQLAPAVSAGDILASATKHGADALGFGDELGTLEPGQRAAIIGVGLPADCPDVEEYLCGGIEPTQVRWLIGQS